MMGEGLSVEGDCRVEAEGLSGKVLGLVRNTDVGSKVE
jgi:hypothetical protein